MPELSVDLLVDGMVACLHEYGVEGAVEWEVSRGVKLLLEEIEHPEDMIFAVRVSARPAKDFHPKKGALGG
jgi:hypothetical protein